MNIPSDRQALLTRALRCPECGAGVGVEQRWFCLSCPASGRIDGDGIVHLSSEDHYYREIPRESLAPVAQASDRFETYELFQEVVESLPSGRQDHIVRYALDPNRGAAICLSSVGVNSMVLDFGSGWGNVTRVASRLGAFTFSVDMTYESLKFSRNISKSNREIYVRVGKRSRLPFADGFFDVVVLNGVLEWLPEGFLLTKNPRDVQLSFMREFLRVLRPSGSLLIGIENRASVSYLRGAREDHTGLRFGAILPRPVADAYSRVLRKRPYRTYTYTKLGYRRLLREAGFSQWRTFIPLPRYRNWSRICEDKIVNQAVLSSDRSPGSNLKDVARRALARAKLYSVLARDYYFLASADARAPGKGFFDAAAEREGDRIAAFSASLSSAYNIVVSGERYVYKLPITASSQVRLEEEVAAVNALKSLSAAPRFLVETAEIREANGIKYGVFSRIAGAVNGMSSGKPRERDAISVLSFLCQYGESKSLKQTGLWRRLQGAAVQGYLHKDGHLPAFSARIHALKERIIRTGPTHGDFCLQNILLSHDGTAVVLDWDRYEPDGLQGLDVLHLEVDARQKIDRASWLVAARYVLEHFPRIESLNPSVFDGLCAEEWLLVYVADRVERIVSAVEHSVVLPPSWRAEARRVINFSLRQFSVRPIVAARPTFANDDR